MQWQEQADTGCSQSQWPIGTPKLSRSNARILKDRAKKVKVDTDTGNCWLCLSQVSDCACASPYLSPPRTVNLADQLPPTPMSGRMTPISMVRDLNWEPSRIDETQRQIGTLFGNKQLPVTYWPLKRPFEFNIIGHSVRSVQTILTLLLSNVKSLSTMDLQALESLGEPGKKQRGLLILRILDPSSGMDIEIKNMLCSTNFEEVSTSPIYFDGLIGTQFLWRSRELPPVW